MSVWNVWTDGSCQHGLHNVPKGVKGWGGWAAVVHHDSDGFTVSGRVADTTNVRMELTAAIEGLRAIPVGAKAVLHTDCTTILCVRDAQRDKTLASNSGVDVRLWRALAVELVSRDVRIHLIVKNETDSTHHHCHVMAGAEARGGLRKLPVKALPLPDEGRLVRAGMRRQLVKSWRDDPASRRRPRLPR